MSLQPLKILKEAIRAVPAVKYALGVAGIVSVVAIVSVFGLSPQWAIIGTVVTMVLMVALLIFAKLTTTAKKHFLLPVMVLMWSFLILTIATACLLFSTVFFKWPVAPTDLFGAGSTNKVSVTIQPIRDLLQAAKMQWESGDYEGGWNSVQEALNRQPDSDEAHQEQIQIAMTWLRKLRVKDRSEYLAVTGKLLPCLTQGAIQAKASLAGDIYAHIGWAYYLQFEGGVQELDIAGQYRKALAADPDNPYAHVMWGHWIMVDHGELSDAKKHFAAALKTGRERAYVRELQISTLQMWDRDENKIELIRIANEMRMNQEALPLKTRERLAGRIYWAMDNDFFQRLRSSLPSAEHLATFLWLTEGMKVDDSPDQTFALARLTEDSGDYGAALNLYNSLLSRPASYQREIKAGIERCKQHSAESGTGAKALLQLAKDKDPKVRERSVRSLLEIGEEPAVILPVLLEALKDEDQDVRAAAGETLIKLGGPGVPALIKMLDAKEPREVQNAAATLGKIGGEAQSAVPALAKLLQSKNGSVRTAVLSALSDLGKDAKAAVPDLILVLQSDPDADARQSAAYALGEIGPEAKASVPDLINLLKNKTDDAGGYRGSVAAEALGKIGPAAKDAVPVLMAALKDDRLRVPLSAVDALGNIGAPARSAIPALLDSMHAVEKDYQGYRAEAIGRIAQGLMELDDTTAVPLLRRALREMREENLETRIISPVQEALETLQMKPVAKSQ